MSRSRKKAKKQLKKQNRKAAAQRPSLPHAKRKGGRYVYPAGAYRAAMSEAPALHSTPPVIAVPAEPEPAGPAQIIEAAAPVAEAERPAAFTAQPWMYGLVLCGFALLAFNMMRPAAPMRRFVEGAIKLNADSSLHDSGLNLQAAEPVPELSVQVDLQPLKEPIESYIASAEGDWAVYIRNLSTDETLVINDHPMPSASLIKLYTAGCYFEETEAGRLEVSEQSETDLQHMISWSDNNAWEDLETLIGHGNYNEGLSMVTAFANHHGFENTGRLIGGESIYSANADNTTTVSETGELLNQIYQGEFVSEAASQKLLELMKNQQITTKIPAGLPEDVQSANKTGELSGIENDAAIVWGKNSDYILVIMSNGNYAGTQPVADLSALIYGLLNPAVTEESNENNE